MAKKDKYAEDRKKIEASRMAGTIGRVVGSAPASLKKGGSVKSKKKKKK